MGVFDPMVGRRLESLIFEHLAARPDLGGSHILSHVLPFATVCYAFRAVSSGHKFDPTRKRFEPSIVRKLLRIKRKLVAGGRIELPTLGL